MSLYWFAGYLDKTYTLNPIRLRGYDAAGNLLYRVRDESRMLDYDLSHLEGDTTELRAQQADFADPQRFVDGFDEWGTAKTLAAVSGWIGFEVPPRQASIRAMATDSQGRIYCAMNPTSAVQLQTGVTVSQLRAIRETIVASGISAYHGWGQYIDGSSPTAYYYSGFIVGFSDTNRYDRLYQDFFRVYNQSGDRVDMPGSHGRPVYAVAADDSYFYLAGEGEGVGQEYLRKFDKSGSQQWAASMPEWMGAEPARYTAASVVFGTYIPEYWTFQYRIVNNIIIDGSGNLYLSGYYDYNWSNLAPVLAGGWMRKYNSAGALQWERKFPQHAVTNCVYDGTHIYVGIYRNDRWIPNQYQIDTTDYYFDSGTQLPAEITKWDASGTLIDFVSRPSTLSGGIYYLDSPASGVRYLQVYDGKLYVMNAYSSDLSVPLVTVYETTALTESTDVMTRSQYSTASGATTQFLIDASGNRVFPRIESVYADAYTDSSSTYIASPYIARHFWRFSSAGLQQWTDRTVAGRLYQSELPLGTYAEAWEPRYWGDSSGATAMTIVASPAMPALPIGLHLGIPTIVGDRYTEIPGLPLGIALGIPDWLREYTATLKLPEIYRLILSGIPPLDFALSSLTLRRSAASRQLTAVIAPPGVSAMTAIDARIGNTLTLYRGVRFADGTEQLEPLFDAPLTTARADRGASNFSITLTAESTIPDTSASTRTLTGISYRNATTSGNRRVRCTIDTYVRPGNTVTFGAESMTVGNITISISPLAGIMEITEAAI